MEAQCERKLLKIVVFLFIRSDQDPHVSKVDAMGRNVYQRFLKEKRPFFSGFLFFFFGLLTRTSSSFFFFFESEGGKGNSVRSQHVMVRVCTRWELSRLLVELFFLHQTAFCFFFLS